MQPSSNPQSSELTPPQKARMEQLTKINTELKDLFEDFTLMADALQKPTYDEFMEGVRAELQDHLANDPEVFKNGKIGIKIAVKDVLSAFKLTEEAINQIVEEIMPKANTNAA